MFHQLSLYQTQRHLGSVNRHIQLLQQIGQTADMVFMSMRQHNTTNFISVGLHICEVRNDNVNTRHVHIRECQSAVQDKHIIATFENGHILSDFIQTAQRNNPNRCPFVFPLIGTPDYL